MQTTKVKLWLLLNALDRYWQPRAKHQPVVQVQTIATVTKRKFPLSLRMMEWNTHSMHGCRYGSSLSSRSEDVIFLVQSGIQTANAVLLRHMAMMGFNKTGGSRERQRRWLCVAERNSLSSTLELDVVVDQNSDKSRRCFTTVSLTRV
jgi:hypothetical protein